jgi:hypothetical protein
MDCPICFDNNVKCVVFNDCCNYKLCENCNQKVNKCPICRLEKVHLKCSDKIIVSGLSGSGKTTYVKDYAKRWYKSYKGKIYVFSTRLSEYSEYDDIEYITCISITKYVIEIMSLLDFQNSLVIIDDVFGCSKQIKKRICEFASDIFTHSRLLNISCIVTNRVGHSTPEGFGDTIFKHCDKHIKLPEQRHINYVVDS